MKILLSLIILFALSTSVKAQYALEFWFPSCGPCAKMRPSLDALQRKYRYDIRRINTEDEQNEEVCAQYNIKRAPTILVFARIDGKSVLVDSSEGLLPYPVLKALLDKTRWTQLPGRRKDSKSDIRYIE
jgi:thioredoxin-like negative regulator of GroEL